MSTRKENGLCSVSSDMVNDFFKKVYWSSVWRLSFYNSNEEYKWTRWNEYYDCSNCIIVYVYACVCICVCFLLFLLVLLYIPIVYEYVCVAIIISIVVYSYYDTKADHCCSYPFLAHTTTTILMMYFPSPCMYWRQYGERKFSRGQHQQR